MKEIIKKEFKYLKPFFFLMLSLSVLTIGYNLITSIVNLWTIKETLDQYLGKEYYGYNIIYFILAMTLTSGLIMREYNDKTMEFLLFLPISLNKVFLAKFFLAVLIIFIIPITDFFYGIISHLFFRNSIYYNFHWDVIFGILFLHFIEIMFLVVIGLFFAFFRRFSWILFGIIFWLFTLLEKYLPGIKIFNFFLIIQLKFRGGNLVIPWKMLLYQGIVFFAVFLCTFFIFIDPHRKLYELYERLKNKSKKIILFLITSAAIIISSTVFIFIMVDNLDNLSEDSSTINNEYLKYSQEKVDNENIKINYKYYQFEYPKIFTERAKFLFFYSDEVYEEISNFFNHKHKNKIYVDMKGKSKNYAGIAHWQNIYLNFTHVSELDEFKAVLAHETTHVFLESLTDRRLSSDYTHNKFFHEGMAGYIEYIYFRDKDELIKSIDQAMLANALREITISELVNNDTFRKYYNDILIYNFGLLFCHELIEEYGIHKLHELLNVIAEKEETFKVYGLEKWRAYFQYADMDIDKVFLRLKSMLKNREEDNIEKIELLKNIKAVVDIKEDEINIIPDEKCFIDGWSLHCFIRDSAEDTNEEIRIIYLDENNKFFIKKNKFYRSHFWYQLYLRKKDGSNRYYFPWKEIYY